MYFIIFIEHTRVRLFTPDPDFLRLDAPKVQISYLQTEIQHVYNVKEGFLRNVIVPFLFDLTPSIYNLN